MPRGWTWDYIEERAKSARGALRSLGVTWDERTWTNLGALSEQLPAADVSSAIAEYAAKYESSVRQLVDTNADFNLTVKEVEVDRKSTRLNSSHANISYAVFCLKKKKKKDITKDKLLY